MSLSTCQKCGGNIPLGPDASNRCEDCGEFVFSSCGPTLDFKGDVEALASLASGEYFDDVSVSYVVGPTDADALAVITVTLYGEWFDVRLCLRDGKTVIIADQDCGVYLKANLTGLYAYLFVNAAGRLASRSKTRG